MSFLSQTTGIRLNDPRNKLPRGLQIEYDPSRDLVLMRYSLNGLLIYKQAGAFMLQQRMYDPKTPIQAWNAGTPIIYFGSSSVWPRDALLELK